MEDYVYEGCLNHISAMGGFETMKNLVLEEGFVRNSARVVDAACNLHRTAHGGFIMTLCDITACMAGYSCAKHDVTLQSNFSFIKPFAQNSEIIVEAKVIHDGKTTQVVEVEARDENDRVCVRATFTLYVTGPVTADEPIPVSPCGRNSSAK